MLSTPFSTSLFAMSKVKGSLLLYNTVRPTLTVSSGSDVILMCLESEYVTYPDVLETTTAPESFAARYSIPVPTTGASGISNGTA